MIMLMTIIINYDNDVYYRKGSLKMNHLLCHQYSYLFYGTPLNIQYVVWDRLVIHTNCNENLQAATLQLRQSSPTKYMYGAHAVYGLVIAFTDGRFDAWSLPLIVGQCSHSLCSCWADFDCHMRRPVKKAQCVGLSSCRNDILSITLVPVRFEAACDERR